MTSIQKLAKIAKDQRNAWKKTGKAMDSLQKEIDKITDGEIEQIQLAEPSYDEKLYKYGI